MPKIVTLRNIGWWEAQAQLEIFLGPKKCRVCRQTSWKKRKTYPEFGWQSWPMSWVADRVKALFWTGLYFDERGCLLPLWGYFESPCREELWFATRTAWFIWTGAAGAWKKKINARKFNRRVSFFQSPKIGSHKMHEPRTVGHKSHDPCFHVFLMKAGVMTFVDHCTVNTTDDGEKNFRPTSTDRIKG